MTNREALFGLSDEDFSKVIVYGLGRFGLKNPEETISDIANWMQEEYKFNFIWRCNHEKI